jgi:hypothetical protein
MLEQKIDALTAAVNQLNETLWQLIDSLPVKPGVAEAIAADPIPAPIATAPAAPTVSRDDVQDLCMTLVRADRSLKNTVRDIIAEFDNAATLKDVKDSDLTLLKSKLEALK